MTGWNDRLKQAKEAAIQELHPDDSTLGVFQERILDAFRMFADALKEPEKCAQVPNVRHPDGKGWIHNGTRPFCTLFPVIISDGHRLLTIAEAFRGGAEIEGRFSDDSILCAKINTCAENGTYFSFLNHGSYRLIDADWFLVTPAPEAQP